MKSKKLLSENVFLFFAALVLGFTSGFLIEQNLVNYLVFIQDVDRLRMFIESFGIFAPFVATFLRFTNVLIAPLPPVVPVVSGYLFGTFEGIVYMTIGASLGSVLAIYIARRYGRPGVKHFISQETLERFDDYVSNHGLVTFTVLIVVPGFPDDALCFVAGLTNLDFKKLTLIASFGRIPGIAALVIAGNSLALAQQTKFVMVAGITLLISLAAVRYRKNIMSRTKAE